MPVHSVAEGHAILQEQELLLLDDAQFELCVIQALYIDK